MSSIVVHELTKVFRDPKTKQGTVVLENMDFEVEEGQFVAILGPSGCGKSTLLRLIAGLEDPSAGTISIAGKDVTAVPAAERELAMVFQNYALFPHLTVAENILFGLKARKVAREVREERLRETAELLELTELLQRKPAALSGGQRQRVALGRALVSGHSLVLMDEPLSNLDARLRAEMRRELRELQRRLGLTVLYVTHDQVEAMTMADRVLVLRSGDVEQYAAPETLYARPATVSVARFVGSPPMNVVEVRAGDLDPAVHSPVVRDFPVLVGVRPEELSFSPGEGGELLCEAVVVHEELLGSDRLVFVELRSALHQRVTIRVSPGIRPGLGSTVRLYARPGALRLFDIHNERALEEFAVPTA